MNRDLFSWKVALAIGAGVTAGVGIAALTFKVLKWRQGGPRTTNMEVSRRVSLEKLLVASHLWLLFSLLNSMCIKGLRK